MIGLLLRTHGSMTATLAKNGGARATWLAAKNLYRLRCRMIRKIATLPKDGGPTRLAAKDLYRLTCRYIRKIAHGTITADHNSCIVS